jgi:hypothetical protein
VRALVSIHVIFVVGNESDVAIINRLRTREPRLCALLRCLCDVALQYNFSFSAAHKSGVDNVLMDWASRPDLHKFSTRPSDVPVPAASVASPTHTLIHQQSLSSVPARRNRV